MPTFGALIAIVFAFMAFLGTFYLPSNALPNIKSNILEGLLDIISSSMLAVTIFSLSIMVSAFASVSSNATPRATELIMGDDNARITIASFISAFIYSVIAKVALGFGYYAQNGRFILFISTCVVLVYIIYTLIKWVHHLSNLARIGNILNKINEATKKAMAEYSQSPNFGACYKPTRDYDIVVFSRDTGYLTHINFGYLDNFCKKFGFKIFINANSGDYIIKGDELAFLYFNESFDQSQKDEIFLKIYSNIVIEDQRSFEQDPRFGFIVLSEVAQKALSPAINDPGTAFGALNFILQLLVNHTDCLDPKKAYMHDSIGIKDIDESEFITQSIDAISRDAATNVEVGLRIQNTLYGIFKNSYKKSLQEVAKSQAKISLKRAINSLVDEIDKQRLINKHHELFGS